jgi:anhydro-N-acetylmuramic acid kinase
MQRLKRHLPIGLRLTLSDEFGIPAQYKEAIKFAALALAAQRHLANNIPAASGASRFAILGKLVAALVWREAQGSRSGESSGIT